MPPQPIRSDIISTDLRARFKQTTTVAASPSGATETVIATLTIPALNDTQVMDGVQLIGWAAFTVGTNGTSAQLRIRQTNSSGNIVANSGAINETAANLDEMSCQGNDPAASAVGTYVLTLTVANGSAASTVSACSLRAVVV